MAKNKLKFKVGDKVVYRQDEDHEEFTNFSEIFYVVSLKTAISCYKESNARTRVEEIIKISKKNYGCQPVFMSHTRKCTYRSITWMPENSLLFYETIKILYEKSK